MKKDEDECVCDHYVCRTHASYCPKFRESSQSNIESEKEKYAEEKVLEFEKWKKENGWIPTTHPPGKWTNDFINFEEELVTIEELYQIFLKE